jgi:hypothetical protein
LQLSGRRIVSHRKVIATIHITSRAAAGRPLLDLALAGNDLSITSQREPLKDQKADDYWQEAVIPSPSISTPMVTAALDPPEPSQGILGKPSCAITSQA